MIKWLAVNEDNMIRFICDTRYDAMLYACDEMRNDIEKGFTPDMYRFIKAEYVGESGDMWGDGTYDEENWRLA